MTALVDVWRAVEPAARLVAPDLDALGSPVRGVARTRTAAPQLPEIAAGELLVVDGELLHRTAPDALLAALADTEARPVGIWVAGATPGTELHTDLPVLYGVLNVATVTEGARDYLAREPEALERRALDLRLGMAEAALVDPRPSTPAALAASTIRRGVAVAVDGQLMALHPRPAGRSLAARFTAVFLRTFAASTTRRSSERRTRDGLWLWERPVRTGASVWLFDDTPFSRTDRVAGDALAITLRALLGRPRIADPPQPQRTAAGHASGEPPGDVLQQTLMAVARANGRVTPAARALGVHRNTVLYRLRRARSELGIDPRRSADALRLLAEPRNAR